MKPEKAVKEYQCCGCINGPYKDCFKKTDYISVSCQKHASGTFNSGIGKIFLGLPKGFNRLGMFKDMEINIFQSLKDWSGYDFLNVPVWKHLDKHGNTIIRGISPRINQPFLHIFLEDYIDKIDCYEITQKDINKID